MEENSFKNLLLIDSRNNDINTIINSIDSTKTNYIIFDYELDTLETIKQNINNLGLTNISNIGIFQENYNNSTYQFVKSFGQSVLVDVENIDPELSSWSQFIDLLQYLKTLGMTNIDLLGCNIGTDSNWNYVMNKLKTNLSITIESSIDNTGSTDLGGNWILESNNSNMINKYFTPDILNYQFVLGSSPITSSTPMLLNNGTALIKGGSSPVYFKNSTGGTLTNIISVAGGGSSVPVGIEEGGGAVIISDSWSFVNSENLTPQNWTGVATSLYGQYITVISLNYVFVSNDYGNTWTNTYTSQDLRSIAMSSNGKYQVIIKAGGENLIYISTDYGITWNSKNPTNAYWKAVSMSTNGLYITAVAQNSFIWISSDYGNNWTSKESSRNWNAVGISGNGQIQYAGVYGGYLYRSLNYGVTWEQDTSITVVRNWTAISISTGIPNGLFGIACHQTGAYSLKNDGSSKYWIINTGLNGVNVRACKVSDWGGYRQLVVSDQIYTSNDIGVTWTIRGYTKNWRSVTMSDNSCIVCGDSSGAQVCISSLTSVSLPGTYYAITTDGSVYAMGSNSCNGNIDDRNERSVYSNGLLGQGVQYPHYYSSNGLKIKINSSTFVTNAIQVEATGDSYAILLSDGKVLVGGSNANGRSGQNSIIGSSYFATYVKNINGLGEFTNVKKIALGKDWLLMLLNDGTVWGCGNDVCKIQYGFGNILIPTQVKNNNNNFITNATDIACGDSHELIFAGGIVYAGGLNTYGQLGIGTTTSSLPTQMKISATQNLSYNVTQISAGTESSCVLVKSMPSNPNATPGGLYSCGRNLMGELGIGNTVQQNYLTKMKSNATTDLSSDNVKMIEQYPYRTVLLYNNGTVKTVGDFNGIPGQIINQSYPVDYILSGNPISNVSSISSRSIIPTSTSDLINSGYTITDLQSLGYTTIQLKNAGYTASQLFGVGFTTSELCVGGFSIIELQQITPNPPTDQQIITAGYSLSDLKNPGNYTVTQLKANYDVSQLFGVGFSTSELCVGGFSVTDLQQITPTPPSVTQIITAGYSLSDLKNIGNYTVTQLKASYTVSQLFSVGFDTSALYIGGFSVTDLQQITPTPPTVTQIITAGYSLSDLKNIGNYSITQLKANYNVSQLFNAGFDASALCIGGFSVTDLQQITPTPTDQQIITAGYDANILKNIGGYSATQLLNNGFESTDLYNNGNGYSIQDLQSVSPLLLSAEQIISAGFSPSQLNDGGYSVGQLKQYSGYNASDLIGGGYFPSELFSSGYSILDLQNVSPSLELSAIINAGYSIEQLRLEGHYDALQIKTYSNFNESDLFNGGFNASNLFNAGYSVIELRQIIPIPPQNVDILTAGFSPTELRQGSYSIEDLSNVNFDHTAIATAGYNSALLFEAGYNVSELVSNYSALELKQGGFPDEDILAANFPVNQLLNASYSLVSIQQAGYPASDLKLEGYNIDTLLTAGFSRTSIVNAGYDALSLSNNDFAVTELISSYTPTDLIGVYQTSDILTAGYSASELGSSFDIGVLIEANFENSTIASAGYNAEILFQAGINVSYLTTDYSPSSLVQGGYSNVDVAKAGFTLEILQQNNFTAQHLKDAGYSADQLYLLYNVSDLKNVYQDSDIISAGYPASKLLNYYIVSDLKTTYSANDLRTANFPDADIIAAGYPVDQLLDAGFQVSDIKSLFSAATLNAVVSSLDGSKFPKSEIISAGYPVQDLFNIGYNANEIYLSYEISDLKNIYQQNDILNAGYSIPALILEGYGVSDFNGANFSATNLHQYFDVSDLKNIYLDSDIIAAGYDASALLGHYSVSDLKMTYSASALKTATFSNIDIINAGYSPSQMYSAGFLVSDIYTKYLASELKNIYQDSDIIKIGYSANNLKSAGYSAKVLRDIGNFDAFALQAGGYSASNLKSADFLASDIYTLYTPLDLRNALYNKSDIIDAGYTALQFKEDNFYSVTDLHSRFSAKDLRFVGFNDLDIINDNYPADKLKEANFTAGELKSKYSASQLYQGGYFANELYEGGYLVSDLKNVFEMYDIINAGYSIKILKDNQYTAKNLVDNGIDVNLLKSNGYTASEMRTSFYNISSLKTLTYSNDEIIEGGFTAQQLRVDGDYSISQIKNHYSVSDIRGGGYTLAQAIAASFTTSALRDGGYTAQQFKDAPINYSASDLKSGNFTTNELKNAGYSLNDILTAKYTVAQLKTAPYLASELKNYFTGVELKTGGYMVVDMIGAGFTFTNLVSLGYSATELRIGRFTILDLKNAKIFKTDVILKAGYSVTDLKNNGYTAAQMKSVNYTARSLFESNLYSMVDIKKAGYTAPQLQTELFTAAQLKIAGFKAIELKNLKYPILDVVNAGYLMKDIKAATYSVQNLREININPLLIFSGGFTLVQLKAGGFTIQEMNDAIYNGISFTDAQLKSAGYTAKELRSINLNLNALKTLKYTPQNLKDAEFTAGELLIENYTAKALKTVGFTIHDLVIGGYKVKDLKAAGFTANECWIENILASEVKAGGFTVAQMKTGGYTLMQFKENNISLLELKKLYSLDELLYVEYTASELKGASFTAVQLKEKNLDALYLKNGGFSATLLKAAKFTAKNLYDAGFEVPDLATAKYTVAEIRDAGYNLSIVKSSFTTAILLKKGGYTATDLKPYFTATQLKAAGFTASQLGPNEANFTAIDLGPNGANFDVKLLKAAGFTALQLGPNGAGIIAKLLKAAGFIDIIELKNAGFSYQNLLDANFTVAQLTAAGF